MSKLRDLILRVAIVALAMAPTIYLRAQEKPEAPLMVPMTKMQIDRLTSLLDKAVKSCGLPCAGDAIIVIAAIQKAKAAEPEPEKPKAP